MICRSDILANLGAYRIETRTSQLSRSLGNADVPPTPNLAGGISDIAGAFSSHPLPPVCFQRDTGLRKRLLDAPFALIRLI
jgi:hypothetical protein